MTVSEAKRLKVLETKNTWLKKLLAESKLEVEVTQEALRKSGERTGQTRAGAQTFTLRIELATPASTAISREPSVVDGLCI